MSGRVPCKSVVLLGKGDLAIRIGEWFLANREYCLECVVPVMPEPRWAQSLHMWADSCAVPVVLSGDYRDIPQLSDPWWRPDVVFSVFYDRIIRQSFIERCGRILNLHNGPLPRYRGVSPINWALKNCEQMHGVTIHEITAGVDDGPIVAQVRFSIYPDTDEVIDVYERALEYGWTLFQETMPILDRIPVRPQDDAQATYYSAAQNALLGERRGFTRMESAALNHRGPLASTR